MYDEDYRLGKLASGMYVFELIALKINYDHRIQPSEVVKIQVTFIIERFIPFVIG